MDLLLIKPFGFAVERGGLPVLLVERADDADALQILTGLPENCVELRLYLAVQRHCDENDRHDDKEQHRDDDGKADSCRDIDGEGQDHGAENDER